MDTREYASKRATLDRVYNNAMIRADRIDDAGDRTAAYMKAETAFRDDVARLNAQRGI